MAIIPLKNNIVALRKGIFDVTRTLIGLESLSPGVPGFEVDIKKWLFGPLGKCVFTVPSLMRLPLIGRLMGALSVVL